MALTKITSRILDSSGVTILGTIATGVWQGTAIASAYLDADTAHLSTTQNFTGTKTFSGVVGIGSTGIYAGSAAILNLQGIGIALKNDKDGSDNNWSYIQNTGTGSASDINFYTGNNESALNLSHSGDATFSKSIKFADGAAFAGAASIRQQSNALILTGGSSGFFFNDDTNAVSNLAIASNGNATFSGSIALGGATIANSYLLEITAASGNIMRSTRGSSQFSMYQANNSDVYLGTTSNNRLRFLQNDGDALCIDTNKKVGIGTTSPAELLEVKASSAPAIQLNQNNQYRGIIRLGGNDLEIRGSSGAMEFYNGAADGDSSALRMSISSGGDATFSKSISLTEMATIIVSDISTGENRGLKLENTGSGGKTWNITPGLTGVNNFTFTIRNATDNINALTIDAAGNTFINGGNLGIGTAGKGIDFTAENTGRQSGADRTGSILDDYEEGTWDPTPGRTGNPQPNVSTYAYREGTYIKVGKLVTVMWDFAATITSQGSTAAISIKGLPFPVGTSIANGGKMAGYSVVQFRSGSLYVNTTAQRSLTGFAQQGATYIYVESQKMGTDGFASAGSVNNYLLNVSSARSTGTCTYFTNA